MEVFELNLEGLVGPTYNYAGAAPGNTASQINANTASNPKMAALQSLQKIRLLHKLGIKQAVMPPHPRPNLNLLQQLGFKSLAEAKIKDFNLFAAIFSAANMWTANSATITPSSDSSDNRLHFTSANLFANLHRYQEAQFSSTIFKKIFPAEKFFCHHPPLPATQALADEGAANHSRLCKNHQSPGIHLFVYGRDGVFSSKEILPKKFPARQTYEAFAAIARNHLINPEKIIFAKQNPKAIDAGVFHNDVISVANQNLFFLHEEAFVEQKIILNKLQNLANFPLHIIEIPKTRISLKKAVKTYIFNSQIITLPSNQMTIIAPNECAEDKSTHNLITELIEDTNNPITSVHYVDVRQSIKNGGGPACLNLRIPINSLEFANMHQGVIVSDLLINNLEQWTNKHYRDKLQPNDLDDPKLTEEVFTALDELDKILDLTIYNTSRAKPYE